MLFSQDFQFDHRQTPVEEITATPGEYVGAGIQQTLELNPFQQLSRLGELGQLQPRGEAPDFPSQGEAPVEPAGLAPSDPAARRLTLDEANERGKEDGLRFSDPPTEAQFNYLLDLKQAETRRAQTLAKSPGLGADAIGLAADFAASAIDPINLASAFVPIVGPARFASLTKSLGSVGRARLATGGIEGAVGTAMVEPLIYGQAQLLQQDFTLSDAFMDVVFGAALGSGLHWGGGYVADKYKAFRTNQRARRTQADFDAYNAWRRTYTDETGASVDWRTIRVQQGETPYVIDGMKPEDRAKVLNSAVKAVENDKLPRVDELMKPFKESRTHLMTDPKYPATVRMRSSYTTADFRADNPATQALEEYVYRNFKGADSDEPAKAHAAILKEYQKRYKTIRDWTIWTRDDESFRKDAPAGLLDDPRQQVYLDPEGKTIVASEGATPGAVFHEINRALDLVQGYRSDQAGGYRYRRGETAGPHAHRRAMEAGDQAAPARSPAPQARSEQAVDLFSKSEPIMRPDQAVSQAIWTRVQDGKDKDLATLIAEEEVQVLEDAARHLQNSARANGILAKVTPVEERTLFDVEPIASNVSTLGAKVTAAVQESVDKELPDADLMNSVRSAMSADPAVLKAWLDGTIDDAEFDALVAQPLPAKTPKEGEGEAAPKSDKTDDPDEEEDLFADIESRVGELLKGMEPADAAKMEANVVAKEQQILSGNRQVKDLFRAQEKDEMDAANSAGALRESAATVEARRGAGAGEQSAGASLEDGLFATRTGGDGPAVGGQGAVIDAERSAGGGDRSPSETARSLALGTVPQRVITPDGAFEVGVEPVIVEYDTLRKAEGKFQPRDRSRKESDANIMARASNLDPEQLMPTRVSDSGPPIVTPDGMVLSGNGRYMTIGTVYRYADSTMGAQSLRYRERLGPAADGFRNPILVMRITDNLTEEQMVKFADKSNRGRIESMSATEKAQRDAHAATIDGMMLYQGGDFESRQNKAFLTMFMNRVATTTELGEMSKNGRLTKEGYDRMNAAVLAAAYDDTGVLSLMLESADLNIRSIVSAYRDVAPAFMKLRAEVAAGVVKEGLDLTPYMMQAARIVSEQREKGVKISTFLDQQDAFNPLDPVVETLIRAFYNAELTRAASSSRISEFLSFFVAEARQHQTGGFLPDDTNIMDVARVAGRKLEGIADDESDPTGLLGPAPEPRESAPAERESTPEPAPEGAGGQAGGGQEAPAAPAAARGNIRANKLRELKDRPADFDAYLKTMGNLKKDDLVKIAEDYIGGELAAKDKRSKQTILDAIKAGKATDTGRAKKADITANLPVPLDSLAGLSVMQLRDVAKKAGVTLGAKTTKRGDIIALMHTIFNADGTRKVGGEPEQRLMPDAPIEYEQQVRRSAWHESGSMERLGEMVNLTQNKLHLVKDPIEKETIREITFMVEDAMDLVERNKFDAAKAQIAEALDISTDLKSNAAKLWTQELRRVAANQGLEVPSKAVEAPSEAPKAPSSPVEGAAEKQGAAVPESVRRTEAGLPLRAFYDYLETNEPVKSAAFMAKRMGVSVEDAGKLLDKGVETGWLRLKDDGTYIRVPKKDRPVRPNEDMFDLQEAPRGWGLDEDEPKTPAELIALTEARAIQWLDDKLNMGGARKVRDAYGFTDNRDYVRIATTYGFRPDAGYLAALMERDLQVQLVMTKTMQEAARILPPSVQLHFIEAIEGFPNASGHARSRQVNGVTEVQIQMVKRFFTQEGKAKEVINHEAVHAMRSLRLFTKLEWDIVERGAREEKSWMTDEARARYLRNYDLQAEQIREKTGVVVTPEQKTERLLEESFAHAYGEWAKTRKRPETPIEHLFQRIKDFIERLAFNAKKFFRAATPEDVMKAIYRGDIASRWSEWNGGRVDDGARNSLRTFALVERTDDLNAGMKALAEDDSSKLANISTRSIEAFVPCVSYHL